MLTLTSPFETPFHRLPAGLKLAVLAVTTLVLVPVADPRLLAVAVAAVAALHLAAGWRFARHGLGRLRPLLPFFIVLAVWHLATSHGDADALAAGLTIGLRMLATVALANLVTMTTRLADMLATLERLLAPLARFGVDPGAPALAVALVIRFTPLLIARAAELADAWRARSPRRPAWRIALPLALAALDDADAVAEALRARGGLARMAPTPENGMDKPT